jgi:hypothetical protein
VTYEEDKTLAAGLVHVLAGPEANTRSMSNVHAACPERQRRGEPPTLFTSQSRGFKAPPPSKDANPAHPAHPGCCTRCTRFRSMQSSRRTTLHCRVSTRTGFSIVACPPSKPWSASCVLLRPRRDLTHQVLQPPQGDLLLVQQVHQAARCGHQQVSPPAHVQGLQAHKHTPRRRRGRRRRRTRRVLSVFRRGSRTRLYAATNPGLSEWCTLEEEHHKHTVQCQ